jgi:hypothetical protein
MIDSPSQLSCLAFCIAYCVRADVLCGRAAGPDNKRRWPSCAVVFHQPADQPDQPDPGLRAHPGPPTLCKSCASLAPLRLDRVSRQSEPSDSFQIRNRSSVGLLQFCPFSSGLRFLAGTSEKKGIKKGAIAVRPCYCSDNSPPALRISVAADAAVLYCRIGCPVTLNACALWWHRAAARVGFAGTVFVGSQGHIIDFFHCGYTVGMCKAGIDAQVITIADLDGVFASWMSLGTHRCSGRMCAASPSSHHAPLYSSSPGPPT